MKWPAILLMISLNLMGLACATGGLTHSAGERELGSNPVNQKEDILYKQAIIRCHKTGGTRIVKINSLLRCF